MQPALPHTEDPIPARAGIAPLFRWVGGKRWLVPFLAPMIHEIISATRGRYIEPFLGGGAMALDLGQPEMVLSDVCKPLVTTYDMVRRNPVGVAINLSMLVSQGVDRETYLTVRGAQVLNPVMGAARFLYLQSLSFNGLYRENSKGQYNVPFGSNAKGQSQKRRIPSREEILTVSRALNGASIKHCDFRDTIAIAKAGDCIYADPPYCATFSNYAAGGFSEKDHSDLASALKAAHERGVYVFASNNEHVLIREIYDWAYITPVTEKHNVGATGERRGARAALLIAGSSDYLRAR